MTFAHARMSPISEQSTESSHRSRLKTSLLRAASGHGPSIGQWIQFQGHQLATMVASLGPDWVLIDCEHGALADQDMHMSVKAVAAAGSTPIVRIPGPEPWMIKRALDSGAHGIMVPMVETVAQAEHIARASRYPHGPSGHPHGFRGLGGLFAPAAWGLGAQYGAYSQMVNNEVVVIVQIETREGVRNCEGIADVNGIDALFIGPNDLSASMGHLGEDPSLVAEVQQAGERVLRAAKNADKFAGYFCLSADVAAQRLAQGWDFVNCGADVTAIMGWMSNEMERLKGLLKNEGTELKVGEGGGAKGYC